MLTPSRLKQLRDRYLELVRLEVEEFGVKATEVRHLVGRLAEFHCALAIGGQLTHQANQPGFDVLAASGRTISVKGTAQRSGFVPISKRTIHKADDLMIIQYSAGQLTPLYYGCIRRACAIARYDIPTQKYEVSIARARKLGDGLRYIGPNPYEGSQVRLVSS
jgi:hypothetical protein